MSTAHLIFAFIFAVGATARISRLVTWDEFPPSRAVRDWYDAKTNKGPWSMLVHCGYCFGMWAGALVVATGYLALDVAGPQSRWAVAWWLITGWLTVSYLGAMMMAYDGDDD